MKKDDDTVNKVAPVDQPSTEASDSYANDTIRTVLYDLLRRREVYDLFGQNESLIDECEQRLASIMQRDAGRILGQASAQSKHRFSLVVDSVLYMIMDRFNAFREPHAPPWTKPVLQSIARINANAGYSFLPADLNEDWFRNYPPP